ncbi:MAG: aminodeoxychorismate synthase component I [Halieaceae bacterium]|jgi:para-aminobenzoate synthetase component I|nr:aminodeoxychorismate synthase component I [Halieaceae bacterium]
MSNTVFLEEITYSPDSCELFERVGDLPGAALLDSSYPYSLAGRYDIITACPAETALPQLPPAATEAQCLKFFEDLGNFQAEHYAGIQPAAQDIPFCGGLLGYMGYDCGLGLNKVADQSGADEMLIPPLALHAYEWAVVQDHLLKRSVFAALPWVSSRARREITARLRRPAAPKGNPFTLTAPFDSNFSSDQYRSAFEAIQRYIQAGDCYQVNLAQRFKAPYEGDPWSAYRELRAAAAAPFSGYIALPSNSAVISLSPERFVSLHGHHVETSPIKGTRPRHSDAGADALAAEELLRSEKDRAENLMIVDLLRNDLGRTCVPGSIHVDRLFELQSFPTVHHLVSTISGELRPDCGAADLLRDSFPGGSITGAPKRRSMEIIAELEPCCRQVYCGSLLYISADGRMDSNIAIRSLLCHQGDALCWGGGGIVADSQWQLEYQETFDKVGKFLQILEADLH